ncbi:MAG: hypothetical protein H7101_03345 [Deinococcales bacterium]|nr:hypothetical protein [Chitinophagaceae bacterium]
MNYNNIIKGAKRLFSSSSTYLMIIILAILVSYLLSHGRTERMRNNHIVLCGKVLEMHAGKGVNVIYEFIYQGKRYEFNNSSPKLTYKNYKNGNFKVLIVIEKGNPHLCEILTEKEQFEELKITQQDTSNLSCNL